MLKICCNVLVMVGLFSCVFGDSEDVVLVRPLVKKFDFLNIEDVLHVIQSLRPQTAVLT